LLHDGRGHPRFLAPVSSSPIANVDLMQDFGAMILTGVAATFARSLTGLQPSWTLDMNALQCGES
jgi:hypothetical protein